VVNQVPVYLAHTTYQWFEDRVVVLASVKQIGYHAIQYADSNLVTDKDIWIAAVSKDGSTLQLAADHLRNDKDVVLAAVTNSALALEHAAEALKSDKEVVQAAFKHHSHLAIRCADSSLVTWI